MPESLGLSSPPSAVPAIRLPATDEYLRLLREPITVAAPIAPNLLGSL